MCTLERCKFCDLSNRGTLRPEMMFLRGGHVRETRHQTLPVIPGVLFSVDMELSTLPAKY